MTKPWVYGEDNDGWYVAEGNGGQRGWALSETDAERIVACLNACQGIDTKVLAANWPNGGLLPTVAIHEKAEGYDAILNELQNLVTALLARRGG